MRPWMTLRTLSIELLLRIDFQYHFITFTLPVPTGTRRANNGCVHTARHDSTCARTHAHPPCTQH